MLLSLTLLRSLLVLVIVNSVFSISAVLASDDDVQPNPASEQKIAEWVEQLDANRFSDRTAASRSLQEAGPAAIAALAEAALGESREARLRSLDILRKHLEDGDEATKQAAKEALEKIAKSDQPAAERAKEILTPKKDVPPPMAIPAFGGQGQIQIRVNAIQQGQVQRIQINNGVKQIETQDGDRKIKITEDPNKGIDVEITTKKDGKETTEKFHAKNADELKKKHPEAHKTYQKMGQGMGNIQIRAAGVPMGMFPPQIQVPMIMPQAQRQSGLKLLKASRGFLENSIKQLEISKADAKNKDKLEESIKRLRELGKQLQEEEEKLAE